MDGLSGATSVIAVVQIAGSICTLLKDFYQGVRDARGEIETLYKAVRALNIILKELQTLINAKTIVEPQDLLKDCRADLVSLENKIGPAAGEQKTRLRLKKYLKWPLKRQEAEKKVETIEHHKSSIVTWLGVENLYVSIFKGTFVFLRHG